MLPASAAPESLQRLPSPCGPLSAWMTLSHSCLEASAEELVRACRHSADQGCFMIALAVGLEELGLKTAFYTDTDNRPKAIEQLCYSLAPERGIPVHHAVGVDEALSRITPAGIGLVCYDTPENEGHISPLTGQAGGELLLPLAPGGRMAVSEFEQRWQAPGILRQLVAVAEG